VTAATTKQVVTPAIYETVTKQELVTPATTKEVVTPAVYELVTSNVLDTPATTEEVQIPAICKMVKTRELDQPAKETKISIPAVYETYDTSVKTAEPYLKWQEILCETNTTEDVVSKLQLALQKENYDISLIDGVYGAETKAAVNAYQEDQNLNKGALTLETLEKLGVQ